MKEYYTTCEIAKFCGVSRITVKNWLEKDILPYFRTSGGHRRVKRADLIEYFQKNNIPLDRIEKYESDYHKKKKILYCWQYFSKKNSINQAEKCLSCIVYQTHTLKCFELVNNFGKDKVNCEKDCSDCEYEKKYKDRLLKIEAY